VNQSGEILVGQVAENKRRGAPQGYRSEIKRHLKQPDPFIFWQQYEYSVETLVSAQIERMKAEAEKMIQDQQLDSVVLTIPASYKGTGQNLMKQAAQAAGFREVTLLAEPVAAAMYYSHQNEHLPISNGDIILVYDLGGGTFDAALIQKQSQGFELIALPHR
jgi:molecular chaperone DnaK (HSP70)